ncbi:endonuclease/exonuclease/phosphatase family protein [Flavobacterium salilacus subsp. salilacus]|uniref:endonuclease/exonuclease/phosphatase family protein n=1 Tax=Flavobacterium TaxID=237 RepID=UPI0010758A01|nr:MULTISPECIES: endonuclease/exonuclease/phosphatase family protein [Flavobacterium]KAF2518919.1 endonuclease/exonuclease/phosphatase family protein [Flavobacterium salilacus subsp. salilacus]MBE1614919.1 endonuclease/exonuclease/phosphatase family protein [Flavobacterium sp. SaA2.13]
MKIVTWNTERVSKDADKIQDAINQFDADIIVLTETCSILNAMTNYNIVASSTLPEYFDVIKYKKGENRTSIWTKYNIVKEITTYDNYTNVSAVLETDLGLLIVYGTIVGVFGGIGKRFETDLSGTLNDLNKLDSEKAICIAGDLNTYFSGYAYPSHKARAIFNDAFKKMGLINLTAEVKDNVDHIVISQLFLKDRKIEIETFNNDKSLSDHIGICITIL